ncbi:MAG TPA: maltotransferase domain-containing protein, partial [Planctomycetota bacterium]|nr:maltotransferase domain-containing protein [Planctomycetota bacterium]
MQEHEGRGGFVEAARSRARAAPAEPAERSFAARDAGLPERQPPRVVIENLEPQVDCGRFPIKRTVGEEVGVTADVHAEGHDVLAAVLLWRRAPAGEGAEWREVPMVPGPNDVWSARFRVSSLEPHEFTVEAWVDRFRTWRRGLERKAQAGQSVALELLEGAELVEAAATRAAGDDAARLRDAVLLLRSDASQAERVEAALDAELARLMARWSERRDALRREPPLADDVDRERARFSSWYELFPRSAAATPGTHGTFADVERLLPYVAGMGFDVLYLPPIHPIGRVHRKGRNNSTEAAPDDTGSPWAIGSGEGGHTSIHPELGTRADFARLVESARGHGLEVALDIAFQCAPDHPWVTEHPQWFRHRPDGSIQYAENPPKRYQDIYPIDFETEDWRELWKALMGVVDFWIGEGVKIFRVDNPHTKPYAFWEWLIAEVRRAHPEVFFLSEAFTR